MQDYKIPFDEDLVPAEGTTAEGVMIDSMLTQKAMLMMRYDDLQKKIMLCGFPPVMIKLCDDDVSDDMLTQWRLKMAMLGIIKQTEKISYNEGNSELLHQYEITIKDIMFFLADDYVQMGHEIIKKAGKLDQIPYLQQRIDQHRDAMDDFEKKLDEFMSNLSLIDLPPDTI